jgi:putative membrane protein
MPKLHKLVYAVYVLIWTIMVINPKYLQDWLLENVNTWNT